MQIVEQCMLVWDLWFTITTLVLWFCPQSQVVIGHKSQATVLYLCHCMSFHLHSTTHNKLAFLLLLQS